MTDTCPTCSQILALLSVSASLHPRAVQNVPHIAKFIDDRCVTGPWTIPSTTLYLEYKSWCRDNMLEPIGRNKFGWELQALGYRAYRGDGGSRRRRGLKLR